MRHMRLDEGSAANQHGRLSVPCWVLFLTASVALRLFIVRVSPYYFEQHDSSYIEGEWGHASYIYEVAEEGFAQLAHNPMDRWGFYNPPLNYWIDASVFNVFRAWGLDDAWAMERVQYVPLVYTVLASLLGVWILHQLGLSGRHHDIAASAWCILPAMIYLSSQLSPDALLLLLSLATLSATLSWYKFPSVPRALLVGVLCGLSIMTKFSGLIALAFPGIAMLFTALTNRPRLELRKVALYSACALVPACLIGGWWHVAMLVMHGMPIGYMQKVPLPNAQYIGARPFWERLFFTSQAIETPFIVLGKGYPDPVDSSILLTELKYIAFDERLSENPVTVLLGWFLLVTVMLYCVVKLTAFLRWILRGEKIAADRYEAGGRHIESMGVAAGGVVVYLAAAVYLALKEPFTCSMSFRYIVPVAALSSAFLGDGEMGAVPRRIVWSTLVSLAIAQTLFYIQYTMVSV